MTTFCRLDELGLVVVGQHLQPDRTVLARRVADDAVEEANRRCRRCGCEGRPRDTVTRRVAPVSRPCRAQVVTDVRSN